MSTYDDIIDLPHPEPIGRQRMPARNRAAQFAPFAALTGFEAALREIARETEARVELSEDAALELDAALQRAAERGETAEFLYFVPDARKAGGRYVTRRGAVRRVDEVRRVVVLEDRTELPIDDLISIKTEL